MLRKEISKDAAATRWATTAVAMVLLCRLMTGSVAAQEPVTTVAPAPALATEQEPGAVVAPAPAFAAYLSLIRAPRTPVPARPYGTRKTRAASNVSPASRTGRTVSPGDAACASRQAPASSTWISIRSSAGSTIQYSGTP